MLLIESESFIPILITQIILSFFLVFSKCDSSSFLALLVLEHNHFFFVICCEYPMLRCHDKCFIVVVNHI